MHFAGAEADNFRSRWRPIRANSRLVFIFLVGAVALWLLLTIIGQTSLRLLTRMRRWDPFGLLPCWYFFAPNPVRYDTVLLWRPVSDRDLGQLAGIESQWKVAAIPYAERKHHVIFNPSRRVQKSVHDLQTAIGNMSDHFAVDQICNSSPVLALRGYVATAIAGGTSAGHPRIQFAIARVTNTRAEPMSQIVFISD